jgi:hypothetical protein
MKETYLFDAMAHLLLKFTWFIIRINRHKPALTGAKKWAICTLENKDLQLVVKPTQITWL